MKIVIKRRSANIYDPEKGSVYITEIEPDEELEKFLKTVQGYLDLKSREIAGY